MLTDKNISLKSIKIGKKIAWDIHVVKKITVNKIIRIELKIDWKGWCNTEAIINKEINKQNDGSC